MAADVGEAIKRAGGEEAIELKLRRFEADVHILQALREALLRQYAESWVAVYDQAVVAHAKTIKELKRQLLQKNIPQNEAAVDFMARERKAMLL